MHPPGQHPHYHAIHPQGVPPPVPSPDEPLNLVRKQYTTCIMLAGYSGYSESIMN